MELDTHLSDHQHKPDIQGDHTAFCRLISEEGVLTPLNEDPDSLAISDTDVKIPRKTSLWSGRSLSSTFILKCLLIFALFAFGYVQAVAECMSGNNLKCFECNSHTDPHCGDPFNWTTLPPRKPCDGCCVKMVQGIGTPDKKIRRGCTDDIDINLFMVDHVCMTEGGGKGKMCFCEENECNAATSPHHFRHFATTTGMSILHVLLNLKTVWMSVGILGLLR